MPSPFPGMDPYIESPALWGEFHAGLVVVMSFELNKCLPPRYAASNDLYVWIHEPDAETRKVLGNPDVFLAERRSNGATEAIALAARPPAAFVFPAVPKEGNKFVKIVDLLDNRVVTVIELISPANKASGPDREAYLAKRNEYLAAKVNIVEMDFHRGGTRLPLGDPEPKIADFYIVVSRGQELPVGGIWSLSVREPLPAIPIPLGPGIADVMLPIRSCMDQVYEGGRFAMKINYAKPPVPPLREPDATWARANFSPAAPLEET